MRGYDEFLGVIFATFPAGKVLLILLALTALVAAGWYWFPAWVPDRLPRIRLPKRRRRQRKPQHGQKPTRRARPRRGEPSREPAAAAGSLADRLAAEGRYAEAIRERLRDTVTALTRAGLITPEPGTTAAELTAEAATGRPVVGPALTGATSLFSEVWYGYRPAGPPEDERMRHLAAEVRTALDEGAAR
ncbi:DUF4129 domain-containing protein [Actinoplanes sp. NEAU-A12]|uniref:DUF4129 domain-containing protein n=1 Tax=Actinoplanes sandaracinus TaxID=3045177 RepID=A0ABT6WZB6_9ACTN|nr:DUF4129 domain-containing protein [Actinoplanes sandaracinus]MDI6105100.1 DUF4129 domain-containing protein [Actinoplanes sandaracinus]